MAYIQSHSQPKLRAPIVIAALAGWNDAAEAATAAIKFLIDRWKPEKFAEIDPEEFYVFTETRPNVRLIEGKQRSIVWPTNQFFAYESPDLSRDIILYLGVEPQLKWRTFSDIFLEVCSQFEVSEVVLLGALLIDVPHALPVLMTGSSSDSNLLNRLRMLSVHLSRYEGPTGMVGVLQDACRRADIPAASLWAAAPHYLAASPNIKVQAALLAYLNALTDLSLNLDGIQSDAKRFDEQITALVERDPEVSEYVRKLMNRVEEVDDEDEDEETGTNPDRVVGTGPLPSADTLIRDVEELLRQHRENGQQLSDDDDDDTLGE